MREKSQPRVTPFYGLLSRQKSRNPAVGNCPDATQAINKCCTWSCIISRAIADCCASPYHDTYHNLSCLPTPAHGVNHEAGMQTRDRPSMFFLCYPSLRSLHSVFPQTPTSLPILNQDDGRPHPSLGTDLCTRGRSCGTVRHEHPAVENLHELGDPWHLA